MRVLVFWIAVTFSVASGTPVSPRIIGGSLTTIEQYPHAASMLYSWLGITYSQACGGSIINTRTVLSAAHCFAGDSISNWRIRVGSSYANSGGIVHSVSNIIIHPNYNSQNLDSDIAVIHTQLPFTFSNLVSSASIASKAYNVPDSQIVWAIGWGATSFGGPPSEQLRHVQIWTVNQNTCRSRYNEWNMEITDNMLCSGWLDVGGRDQCQGDSGGPLLHNSVVVGICSWGYECARARFPGVNVRVSRFTSWIIANA